jgi:hypothetical protein
MALLWSKHAMRLMIPISFPSAHVGGGYTTEERSSLPNQTLVVYSASIDSASESNDLRSCFVDTLARKQIPDSECYVMISFLARPSRSFSNYLLSET